MPNMGSTVQGLGLGHAVLAMRQLLSYNSQVRIDKVLHMVFTAQGLGSGRGCWAPQLQPQVCIKGVLLSNRLIW